MKLFTGLRTTGLLLVVLMLIGRSAGTTAGQGDFAIADLPLFSKGAVAPLMMLVASRDEQLFDKAYTDYVDMNGDGVVDNTYNDTIDYEGYFDPFLCYVYAAGEFKSDGNLPVNPRNPADGVAKSHKCGGGKWSGNFLNWITMSRLDMMRYVLYGGKRSAETATRTTLERAQLPPDMHAWSKVYSGADLANLMPSPGGTTVTFCNVSSADRGGVPLLRVAAGAFPSWGVTEEKQCQQRTSGSLGNADRPATFTDYTVRVTVCDQTLPDDARREFFCSRYGSTTASFYRPVGLLQKYGESGQMRFGLISGSYSQPRAGGVLRKNIGKFAGNGNTATVCADGDEVRLSDGTFCNQGNGQEGIVNTLSRFELADFNGSSWFPNCDGSKANRGGARSNGNLNDPGPNSGNGPCTAWGNPVAEMYAEALRYIAGGSAGTNAFTGGNDLNGLPTPGWVDPYGNMARYGGGNPWCAKCSVMILSSGTPSYDGNAIPSVPGLPSAIDATSSLGATEGINGNVFIVGGNLNAARLSAPDDGNPSGGNLQLSHQFICAQRNVPNLGWVRGLCDDSPQREGSFLTAGLAKAGYEGDLRTSVAVAGRPADTKTNVKTFAVALADTLPKIELKTAAGVVTIAPYCQVLQNGNTIAQSTEYYSCQLGDALAGQQVSSGNSGNIFGRNLSATGGSLMFSWDGSPLGESNDRDIVFMISYCVGASCASRNAKNRDICWGASNCSTSVGANEVLVRTEIIGASSGNRFKVGFNISGTTADRLYGDVTRPGPFCDGGRGGAVYNLLNDTWPCTQRNQQIDFAALDARGIWDNPQVVRFTPAGGASASLKPVLWYAAKYGAGAGVGGSGADTDNSGRADWDEDGDGEPDNYLLARNPSRLRLEMDRLIASVLKDDTTTGGSLTGARVTAGSFTVQTEYSVNGNDWVGNIVAIAAKPDGSDGAQRWSATSKLPAAASRNIRTTLQPTALSASGAVQAADDTREFTAGNLYSASLATKWPRNWLGVGVQGPAQVLPVWLGADLATPPDQKLVNYLRGDQSNEIKSGGRFRTRSSVLGDIVNSTPEIAAPTDDFGYGTWALFATPTWKKALGDSYAGYLKAKKDQKRTTVLVGANDGMLHAFNGDTGVEQFAYIPSVALAQMGELANPAYTHTYKMDGYVVSGDVPTTATGGWRTLAVAAAGAGGPSVSALDIGNPSAFNDSSVLWELAGTTTGVLADLGYVFGKPQIVPVRGVSPDSPPRWVAIFGNGVNSTGGAPALFVVDANTGAVLKVLKPAASYSGRNGIVNIAAGAVYNTDGLVDTVYGGDMRGNLWKFDLSSASISEWNVDFGGLPLFTAVDDVSTPNAVIPQPITGGIEISRGPGGGATVFFGTGQYFAEGDNLVPTRPRIDSLYGIVDNCLTAACESGTRLDVTGTGTKKRSSVLIAQNLTTAADASGVESRNVSRNSVTNLRGWYVDLRVGTADGDGERFVGNPRLQSGKVFFTTFQPTVRSACDPGGTNWLYGLDIFNGGGALDGTTTAPGGQSVCTGNCGALATGKGAPNRDSNVLVPQPVTGNLSCPATDPNCNSAGSLSSALGQRQCTMVLRSPGATPLYMPRPCGRQSWRQVR